MRQHTKEFKNEIQKNGRQLDSKIIIKGSELVLGAEDLFSVTPVTNSTLLKSVMKEVDFESKQKISVGQEINVQSGVKVGNKFEYLIFGNYVVYKNEYNAETESYSHICYDKMLNTMIDYTPLDITYPINLREYINAIATKCGLEFADKNNIFANYNTSINEDHFSNGNYTFRDVLDYIAQLVGGWLCINDNDELEIRYPKLARNYGEANGEDVSFTSNVEDEINTIIVDGKSTQATSTDPVSPSPDNPSEIKSIKGTNLLKGLSTSNTDTTYWNNLNKNYFTPLSNGWGRWEVDNTSGTSTIFANAMVNLSAIDLKPSTTYTFVVEIRNSTISESSGAYLQVITANATGAFKTGRLIGYQDINENKTIVFNSTTKDSFNGVTRGVDTYLRLGTGTKGTVEARISLFEYGNNTSNTYVPCNSIQSKIVGKNLFDKNSSETQIGYFTNDGTLKGGGSSTVAITYTKIVPNNDMTISGIKLEWLCFYDKNKNFIERIAGERGSTSNTFNKNANYIRFQASTSVFDLDKIQLELGTQATEYELYQEKVLNIDLQGNELCSLPNNIKDELVIENGRAKIIKRIGKVVLDGSDDEKWTLNGRNQGYAIVINDVGGNSNSSIISGGYCDCLSETMQNNIYSGRKDNVFATIGGTVHKIYVRYNSSITSIALLKEQLNSQPIIVQYELAEPYTEEVGKVETLSTFKGVNNVSLDANMQTNMSLTYTTEFEELDKHFLKDVNVSFYKKYGAVNSVVFSRGNGSDNIYRKDNMSISRNGLTEIKITGNPFLEGNDRENFIQQLFDKINGLEFYIMDVASTGIMYLELGDLYYFNMVEEKPSLKSGLVKSGMRKAQGSSGGKHLCLLMNDEINITQGLEENIYTDEPEITETDYKTASITDTSIKNAIIQTNKNSAEILLKVNSDEVVSAINLSPESIKISSAKLDIDAIATFTNSKLAEAGSTVINGANITTGSISCDRLNGGTINGQTIRGGSISIQTGNYYFDMGTSTSNPNCSGLNVGYYGIKAYSNITATGFAITDSDTGKSQSINIYDGHGRVWYLTFTGGILTASEYK